MKTQADSYMLGMPPDGVEATAPTSHPLRHHFVPAADLEIGQQIRDRGALHTIDAIEVSDQFGSIALIMEDGGRLGGIPLHQDVTVWTEAASHV